MVIGIILDIVILALIVLSTYLGYRRGFVNLAVKLVALVISILVTVVLYNPIANLVINVTSVDETLENHIYEKVMTMMEDENNQEKNYLGITVEQARSGLLPVAAREMSINIIRLAVFIILLLGIRIAVRCIKTLADFIAKLPILKQFNKIGGVLYGIIRGILIVFIGLTIVQFITNVNPQNIAYQTIEKTYATKIMYENNVINMLFK